MNPRALHARSGVQRGQHIHYILADQRCLRPLQPAGGALAIADGVIAFDAAVGDDGDDLAGLGAVEAMDVAGIGDIDLHLLDGEIGQIAFLTPTVCAAATPGSASAAKPAAVPAAEAVRKFRRVTGSFSIRDSCFLLMAFSAFQVWLQVGVERVADLFLTGFDRAALARARRHRRLRRRPPQRPEPTSNA